MGFESFDDLARVGLKRTTMGAARVLVKSEFGRAGRAQTIFRFSDDLVERAGWTPGADRIELSIDRSDLAIRARRTVCGGYKLIGNGSARAYVKFTAARGMPLADAPTEATDVVVVGGELMFVLPDGVRIAAG
jgi:hypothetical protein